MDETNLFVTSSLSLVKNDMIPNLQTGYLTFQLYSPHSLHKCCYRSMQPSPCGERWISSLRTRYLFFFWWGRSGVFFKQHHFCFFRFAQFGQVSSSTSHCWSRLVISRAWFFQELRVVKLREVLKGGATRFLQASQDTSHISLSCSLPFWWEMFDVPKI